MVIRDNGDDKIHYVGTSNDTVLCARYVRSYSVISYVHVVDTRGTVGTNLCHTCAKIVS